MVKEKQAKPKLDQAPKISEMKDYELGMALNEQHNIIHQAQQQITLADQNIRSLMAEIEKRGNDAT